MIVKSLSHIEVLWCCLHETQREAFLETCLTYLMERVHTTSKQEGSNDWYDAETVLQEKLVMQITKTNKNEA